MMKYLKAVLYVAASIGLFYLLRINFPKYSGAMGVYLVLFLLDGYLWISTWKYLRKKNTVIKFLGAFFYWLPLLLILGGFIYGWFVSFLEWNILFRTEFLNLIQTGYAVKALPYAFRLLYDLMLMIFGTSSAPSFYGIKPRKPRNRMMITGWSLGFVLGAVLLAGHFFGQYPFRLKRVDVQFRDLPTSFDNLRIVQISDLHLGNWTCPGKLEEAVARINRLHPDLILITGDVATFSTTDILPFQSTLGRMKAREGIWVIYGNHDYGQYYKFKSLQEVYDNLNRFGKIYGELGWNLLANGQSILVRGNDSITILGVENWGEERRFPKLAEIVKAEEGTENIRFKILLSHDPTYWEKMISRRCPEIDLTLSGHSHGGQVGYESHGSGLTLVSELHPYWAGLHSLPSSDTSVQYLYVNRGLGTVGYFGRIGIPPEITLLILHRQADSLVVSGPSIPE